MDSEKKSLNPDDHDLYSNHTMTPSIPQEAPPYTPPMINTEPKVITMPPPYSPNDINIVNTVVVKKAGGAGLAKHYNDYMALSIIMLLFFCLPFGIAALVFSCKMRKSMQRADMISAEKESRIAFILNMVALTLGLLAHATWIGLLIHAVIAAKCSPQGASYESFQNGMNHEFNHEHHEG
ncbi:proline-rich transmembrane 1-like [Pelobates cultripes]|uniref:Proline-rich transmembrane 1-like n=1 Tax=Pelobates cultripes TaxID=61616 RepID=A0AAD1T7D8_PELCU|nr:proline-rich transmembrane 1-like [Pelobates cultripes]